MIKHIFNLCTTEPEDNLMDSAELIAVSALLTMLN